MDPIRSIFFQNPFKYTRWQNKSEWHNDIHRAIRQLQEIAGETGNSPLNSLEKLSSKGLLTSLNNLVNKIDSIPDNSPAIYSKWVDLAQMLKKLKVDEGLVTRENRQRLNRAITQAYNKIEAGIRQYNAYYSDAEFKPHYLYQLPLDDSASQEGSRLSKNSAQPAPDLLDASFQSSLEFKPTHTPLSRNPIMPPNTPAPSTTPPHHYNGQHDIRSRSNNEFEKRNAYLRQLNYSFRIGFLARDGERLSMSYDISKLLQSLENASINYIDDLSKLPAPHSLFDTFIQSCKIRHFETLSDTVKFREISVLLNTLIRQLDKSEVDNFVQNTILAMSYSRQELETEGTKSCLITIETALDTLKHQHRAQYKLALDSIKHSEEGADDTAHRTRCLRESLTNKPLVLYLHIISHLDAYLKDLAKRLDQRSILEQTVSDNHSSLTNQPTFPKNKLSTVMSHYFGDSFTKESYLEGGHSKDMIHFAEAALSEFLTKTPNSPSTGWLLEAIQAGKKADHTFDSKKLTTLLSDLPVNAGLILPAGWAGTAMGGPGHATYLKIKKTGQDMFEVCHYNLGDGSQIYQSSVYIPEEKSSLFFPYVKYQHVPLNTLTNPLFLAGLNEMKSAKNIKWDAEDLYGLLNFLGEPTIDEPVSFNQLQTPQHSGVCSWRSLSAILIDEMKLDYPNFYFQTGLHLLTDFQARLMRDNRAIERSNLDILNQCIDSFLHQVHDYNNQYPGCYSEEDLRLACSLQTLKRQNLKAIRHLNQTQGETLTCDESMPISFNTINHDELSRPALTQIVPSYFDFRLEYTAITTRDELRRFISTAHDKCHQLLSGETTKSKATHALKTTSLSILHLPLPNHELWKEIHDKTVLTQLLEISEMMVKSLTHDKIAKFSHKSQIDALLATYQLLGIITTIIKNEALYADFDHRDREAILTWANTVHPSNDLSNLIFGSGDSNLYSHHQFIRYNELASLYQDHSSNHFYVNLCIPDNWSEKNHPLFNLLRHFINQSDLNSKYKHPAYLIAHPPQGQQPVIEPLFAYQYFILALHHLECISSGDELRLENDQASLRSFNLVKTGNGFRIEWDVKKSIVNANSESVKRLFFRNLSPLFHYTPDGHAPINTINHPINSSHSEIMTPLTSFINTRTSIETVLYNLPFNAKVDPTLGTEAKQDLLCCTTSFDPREAGITDIVRNQLQGHRLISILTLFHSHQYLFLEGPNKIIYQEFFKRVLFSFTFNKSILEKLNHLENSIKSCLTTSLQYCLDSESYDSIPFILKMMIFAEPRIQMVNTTYSLNIPSLLQDCLTMPALQEHPHIIQALHYLKWVYLGQQSKDTMDTKLIDAPQLEESLKIALSISPSHDYYDADATHIIINGLIRHADIFQTLHRLDSVSYLYDATLSYISKVRQTDAFITLCGQDPTITLTDINGLPCAQWGDLTLYFPMTTSETTEACLNVDNSTHLDVDKMYRLLSTDFLLKLIDEALLTPHLRHQCHVFISHPLTQPTVYTDTTFESGLLFFDKETKKCIASASFTFKNHTLMLSKLTRKKDDKQYLNPSKSGLDFLERIETSLNIECLGESQSHRCNEIHLHRMGFHFTYNDSKKLYICESPSTYKGFHIDPKQRAFILQGFQGFLRLKKDNTAIIIVPTLKTCPKSKETSQLLYGYSHKSNGLVKFGMQYEFERDTPISEHGPAYIELDPSAPLSGGKNVIPYIPDTITALYLIYLFTTVDAYTTAFTLMNEWMSNPLPLTSSEKDILITYFDQVDINQPRGASLFLKMLSHLIDREDHDSILNTLFSSDNPSTFVSKTSSAITTYFNLPNTSYDTRLATKDISNLTSIFKQFAQNEHDILKRLHPLESDTPIYELTYGTGHLDTDKYKDLQAYIDTYRSTSCIINTALQDNVYSSPIHYFWTAYYHLKNQTDRASEFKTFINIHIQTKASNVYIRLLYHLAHDPDSFISFDELIQNVRNDSKYISNQFSYLSRSNLPTPPTPRPSLCEEPQKTYSNRPLDTTPIPRSTESLDTFPELTRSPRIHKLLLAAKDAISINTTPDLIQHNPIDTTTIEERLYNELHQDLVTFQHQQEQKQTKLINYFSELVSNLQSNTSVENSDSTLSDEAVSDKGYFDKLKWAHASAQDYHQKKAYQVANQYPPAATAASLNPEVHINDLLKLFPHASRDITLYKSLNPFLSDEDCSNLDLALINIIQHGRRAQSLDRLQLLYTELTSKECDVIDVCGKIKKELESTHAYQLTDTPELALFEFRTGYILTDRQIQTITNMKESVSTTQTIHQLNMGEGKTSVIMPLLGHLMADGKNLFMALIPEELLDDFIINLRTKSSIFGQTPFLFKWDRNKPITVEYLKWLHTRLEHVIEDKDFLVSTPKSIHCFKLSFFERLYLASCSPNESDVYKTHLKIATLIGTILSLFSKSGRVVADETDTILNCKNEVNFTLGKTITTNTTQLSFLVELHRLVHSEITDPNFDKCNFQEALKARLLNKLSTQPTLFSEPLRSVLSNPDLKSICLDFLNGSIDSLDKGGFPNETQDILYLLRQELDELLSITYQKEIHVHFGPSPNHREVQAIPYLANNKPSLTSRFDQIHEILNYTIQMAHELGISVDIITSHLFELQTKIHVGPHAVKKVLHHSFPDLADTIFNSLLSEKNMSVLAATVAQYLNQKPALVDQYLINFVLPKILVFSHPLNSNPYDLVDMFQSFQGFTGTPWNKDTFPIRLTTQIDPGTAGKSLHIFYRDNTTLQLENSDATKTVESRIRSLDIHPHTRAFIDAGALLKGASNGEIAHLLFQTVSSKNPDILGVIFYENDRKKVLLKQGQQFCTIEYLECAIDRSSLFTYYDHAHCTGSDIPQMDNAQAIISFGKHLKSRDLFQSMWRMRGLLKQQSLTIFVDSEVQTYLNHDVSKHQLLTFSLKNEAKQLEIHLLQSSNSQFAQPERHNAYQLALGDRPLESESFKLFIREREISPKQLYNRKKQFMAKDNMIQELRQRHSTLKSAEEERSLEIILDRLNKTLPNLVFYPATFDDTQNEIEQEQEQQQENQLEILNQRFDSELNPWTMNYLLYAKLGMLYDDANQSENERILIPNFFSKNLIKSLNLSSLKDYGIFYIKSDYMLVLFKKTHGIKVMMLHEIDVDKIIHSDPTKLDSDIELCVIASVNTGELFHSVTSLNDTSPWFSKRDEIETLQTQIKFYNGDMDYSDAQIDHIRNWLNTADVLEQARTFFEKVILERDPQKKQFYPYSSLYHVLYPIEFRNQGR